MSKFKTLFKEDDWEIVERVNASTGEPIGWIAIKHDCSERGEDLQHTKPYDLSFKSFPKRLETPCDCCRLAVPDHIQALFLLLYYNYKKK